MKPAKPRLTCGGIFTPDPDLPARYDSAGRLVSPGVCRCGLPGEPGDAHHTPPAQAEADHGQLAGRRRRRGVTICATCGDPIVKVGQTRTELALWDHDGESADHPATPRPTCPQCGSADYRVRHEAWGDSWDCAACGHHDFHSLGD